MHIFTPISLRFFLILSSHLHLGLPSGLFLSGFPTKILYAFLLSSMRATCSAHLILLNMIALIIFCEAYKLCSVLQLPATSSLLGPNIHRSPSGSLTYTTFEIPSFEMVWSWYLSRLPCLRSHRKAEGGGGGILSRDVRCPKDLEFQIMACRVTLQQSTVADVRKFGSGGLHTARAARAYRGAANEAACVLIRFIRWRCTIYVKLSPSLPRFMEEGWYWRADATHIAARNVSG